MGTRNKGIHVPSAAHNLEEKLWKIDGDLGINTWWREPSTSGKARRWTMKQGGWGSFNMTGENLPIW